MAGAVSRLWSTVTSTWSEYWYGSNGNAHVHLGTLIAGEENYTSSTGSFLRTHRKCNVTIVSKTTAATIGAGAANDTLLLGVHISTALTGTCVIAGFFDDAGVAQSFTLPAGSVGWKEFHGAVNAAGALTVTCSNVADDNLVAVMWWPA